MVRRGMVEVSALVTPSVQAGRGLQRKRVLGSEFSPQPSNAPTLQPSNPCATCPEAARFPNVLGLYSANESDAGVSACLPACNSLVRSGGKLLTHPWWPSKSAYFERKAEPIEGKSEVFLSFHSGSLFTHLREVEGYDVGPDGRRGMPPSWWHQQQSVAIRESAHTKGASVEAIVHP